MTRKSVEVLPEGYGEILHIDLQKDKKLALVVNGLGAVVMAVMLAVAACFVPFGSLYDVSGTAELVGKFLALFGGFAVYMVLHEAVHGIAMRHYCGAKVKYGFTGAYAYAGSEGYYCRKDYTVIGLAPVVVWGILLAVLNFVVPTSWFYVVYFIQVGNISGAAGDLYVAWRMNKLPADILVRDSGVSMTVYSAEAAEEKDFGNEF